MICRVHLWYYEMSLENFKYGIRFHDISKCDQTWMTCCALHNYLLDKDGLAEGWEKGLSPDEDDFESISMPFALRKLLDINLAQRYDTSGSGIGNYVEIDSGDAQSIAECNAQPLQINQYKMTIYLIMLMICP